MKRRMALLALAAVTALSGAAAGPTPQKDSVYPLRGQALRGRITKISPAEVVITLDVGGGERKLKVNELQKVAFAEEPSELRLARDYLLQERLEDARAELAKIAAAEVSRAEVKEDILYYSAYCASKLALESGGDKVAAGNALRAFIENHAQSYHYFPAVELFGDLAYSGGYYDTAAKHYRLLAEAPWPDAKLRGALAEGRSLAAEGQFQEALQRYESVLSNGLDSAEAAKQKLLATVGKAVCLAKTGKHEEGVQLVQKVIADNDPQGNTQLFARAYNALGACCLEAGQTKDSLLAYLHVDLLFQSDRDAHAEALYHLAKLWAAVNRSDRAVKARSRLQSLYAASVWAEPKPP